jgi:sister-chromatid-cohesion protein PDS5
MSIDRDAVFDRKYLGNASNKINLIKRLKAIHKRLTELGQDQKDLPKGLQSTADQLVSIEILDHSDENVQLHSVYCIVDILRVFAPEAPYGDEDMVHIFNVIIPQIKRLSTCDIGSRTWIMVSYIIKSLSTLSSCLIPVNLVERGVPGAEYLMTSLFDAIISVFKPEHPDEGECLIVVIVMNRLSAIHA